MNQHTQQSGFRTDIEGLRGIAVLIVVAFHCGMPGFGGGFSGVDVFFVLSGYLITGLLVSEIEKTRRLSLLQFYSRRLRRLLPACALTLFVTMLVGSLVLSPHELTFAGRAARATALYLSNIFFAINAADYFSPNVATNPMLHTWSLAVEEQFYICWPLLIMAGLLYLRSRKALISILASVTFISFCISIWTTAKGGTFAFYQLPARAWEFGIGGLAVILPRKNFKISYSVWMISGWAGIAAIFAGTYWISGEANFPGWVALLPVIGTVIALLAGAELPCKGVGVLLGSTPLQYLGTMSYSWYLWHWPFLVLATALQPEISVAGKLGVAVLSLLLAHVTHHFIENPVRFHPYLARQPWATIAMASGLMVLSVATSVASIGFASRMANRPEMKQIMAAAEDISRMPRKECVTLGEMAEVKKCSFGEVTAATQIVLFGDSHAIQWFNPLEKIAQKRGWRLTTMVKSGCQAIDIRSPEKSRGFERSCDAWRTDVLRQIEELRPASVIIGSASSDVKSGNHGSVSTDEWRQGTERILRRLAVASDHVILIRDTPFPRVDIPTCLARSARHSWYPGGACEMIRAKVLNQAIFEAEQAAAKGLHNVHLIDMTDQLCQEETCWAIRNNEIIYRDDNHLTGQYADSLWTILDRRLAIAMGLNQENQRDGLVPDSGHSLNTQVVQPSLKRAETCCSFGVFK